MSSRKVQAEQSASLLELVMKAMGYTSNTKGRNLIKGGFVKVNGKLVRIPGQPVEEGDFLSIEEYDRSRVREQQHPFPFEVLADTKEYVAFIKPAGMPMLDDRGKGKSVQRLLRSYLERLGSEEDLFVVNKLDPPCSGIAVACKDVRQRAEFEERLFEARHRWYALVQGRVQPVDGTWSVHLRRNKDGVLIPIPSGNDAKEATLKYRTLNGNGQFALLKVDPETSLRHQERAVCAASRHPIVGDRRYHAKEDPLKRLGLHLFSLEFTTPKGQPVTLKTPVPRVFLTCVKGR